MIAGLLCLCAAAIIMASAIAGLWSFTRPSANDVALTLRRAQAPTQLAAGVMLVSGGAVALVAPHTAVLVLVMCVAGAIGTVAAGCWQSARYVMRRQAVPVQCGGSCSGCTRPCP